MRQTTSCLSLAILMASGLFSATALAAPPVRSASPSHRSLASSYIGPLEARLPDPATVMETSASLSTRSLDALINYFLPRTPQAPATEPDTTASGDEEPVTAGNGAEPVDESTPRSDPQEPEDLGIDLPDGQGGLTVGGVKVRRDEQAHGKPLVMRTAVLVGRQFTNETTPVNGTETEDCEEEILKRDTKIKSTARTAVLLDRQVTNGTNPGNGTDV